MDIFTLSDINEVGAMERTLSSHESLLDLSLILAKRLSNPNMLEHVQYDDCEYFQSLVISNNLSYEDAVTNIRAEIIHTVMFSFKQWIEESMISTEAAEQAYSENHELLIFDTIQMLCDN